MAKQSFKKPFSFFKFLITSYLGQFDHNTPFENALIIGLLLLLSMYLHYFTKSVTVEDSLNV